MSKAVLISIRPTWCALIAAGRKTVEIRTNRPNLETPFNLQLVRSRKIKAEKRQSTERAITEEEANRKYCKSCIYCGVGEYSSNLCDYLLDTGHIRGCKYGVGCEKRILKEAKHDSKTA